MLPMRKRFKKAWLYWLLPPTTAAPFLHSLTTTVHFPRCVRLENTVHSVAPLITGRFTDRLFGMCVSVWRNECWKSFRSSATVEAASTETLPQSASTDRRLPTQPLTWYPEEKWRTCAEQWVAQKLHNHISIAKAFLFGSGSDGGFSRSWNVNATRYSSVVVFVVGRRCRKRAPPGMKYPDLRIADGVASLFAKQLWWWSFKLLFVLHLFFVFLTTDRSNSY